MTVNTDLHELLLDEIRAATGLPGLRYASRPESLSGGFWAELLAFSLSDPPPGWPRDLVARVMPDAALARKETIVQAAVSAAGFPTPAVRASGGPECGLGRAFMVMDRAPGAPLLPGLRGVGAVAAGLRQAVGIPEVLASTMASLHALDPRPVCDKLAQVADVPLTIPGLLDAMEHAAAGYQRADLVGAARWLTGHSPPPRPEVICHGDLHPFNLLVGLADRGQVTVVDWSTALLAPRAYDVAFTTVMLAEPPLLVPAGLRPIVWGAGRALARRFLSRYQAHAATEPGRSELGRSELRWHRGVVRLRSLTEVAGWVHDGIVGERAGHPWLVMGQSAAAYLSSLTGVPVRPR